MKPRTEQYLSELGQDEDELVQLLHDYGLVVQKSSNTQQNLGIRPVMALLCALDDLGFVRKLRQ